MENDSTISVYPILLSFLKGEEITAEKETFWERMTNLKINHSLGNRALLLSMIDVCSVVLENPL